MRELAWQRRATGVTAEHDPPGYLRGELGPTPEAARGRRAWRQAATAIEHYRRTYGITDPDQALGPVPREPVQRAAWQHARTAAQRAKDRQRTSHRQERTAATRPAPIDPSQHHAAHARDERLQVRRHGPERAAG
jgi:hypothetical protein